MLLFRDTCLPLILALLISTQSTAASGANWITLRNDTTQVIVVQEVITQDGQVKRLKPVRLLPGEAVRQSEPSAGVKRFEVFDGKNTTPLLWAGELRVAEGDQVFSIAQTGGKHVVREVPAKRP